MGNRGGGVRRDDFALCAAGCGGRVALTYVHVRGLVPAPVDRRLPAAVVNRRPGRSRSDRGVGEADRRSVWEFKRSRDAFTALFTAAGFWWNVVSVPLVTLVGFGLARSEIRSFGLVSTSIQGAGAADRRGQVRRRARTPSRRSRPFRCGLGELFASGEEDDRPACRAHSPLRREPSPHRSPWDHEPDTPR
jgi:hypothetical protein